MKKLEIIMPATDAETNCLPVAVESVAVAVRRCEDIEVELKIVCNRTKGPIIETAEELVVGSRFDHILKSSVIHSDTPGKNVALNKGLEHESDTSLILDSDCTISELAIRSSMKRLERGEAKVVSLMHLPRPGSIKKIEDEDLARIIQMNALRRLAAPGKTWLHGAFMMFDSNLEIDGVPLRFPEQSSVADDNWLTAAICHNYGPSGVHVDYDNYSFFGAPDTWGEYYDQQARYRTSKPQLIAEAPEYKAAYEAMFAEYHLQNTESEVDAKWRELCVEQGIDFADMHPFYEQVLANIATRVNESSTQSVSSGGTWAPQASTKQL